MCVEGVHVTVSSLLALCLHLLLVLAVVMTCYERKAQIKGTNQGQQNGKSLYKSFVLHFCFRC